LPPTERLSRQEGQALMEKLRGYVDVAKDVLQRSQDRMTLQANKKRREPDFGVGDRVFILKKTSPTDRPSDKLDFPMTKQHFKIVAKRGWSYELEVPAGWRAQRVFHADRLRKYANNPLPGQEPPRPAGSTRRGRGRIRCGRDPHLAPALRQAPISG
jgi:hypothetical protein